MLFVDIDKEMRACEYKASYVKGVPAVFSDEVVVLRLLKVEHAEPRLRTVHDDLFARLDLDERRLSFVEDSEVDAVLAVVLYIAPGEQLHELLVYDPVAALSSALVNARHANTQTMTTE